MDNAAPGTGGKKYYEYLNRVVVTNEHVNIVRNEELAGRMRFIDTGTPQAVIFVEGKDVFPGSLTGQSSIVSGAGGGAIGAVAGLAILVGFGLCATIIGCTVGAFFVAAGAGATGYLIGSDYDPDIDARVLLWPYTNDDLKQLKPGCTILEGQDNLEIKK